MHRRSTAETIDFLIEDAHWRRIPHLRARLEKAAAVTLEHLPKAMRFPVGFTLVLTDNAAIRNLNRDFRGFDKPTNVLSFPQFLPAELTKMGKAGKPVAIGDIVIAYQYIVDEAKNDHKILINHAVHLLIHGLLHLFGYDHMHGTEAMQMERLERRIMSQLGLPDPYKIVEPEKAKKTRAAGRKAAPKKKMKKKL